MITCIIIDDEPKAIELLKLYCERLSDLKVTATFRDPIEALQYVNNHDSDLIFLDINMPKLNGISLAKILKNKDQIVFTTAYSEYAVESYDLGAMDYLLKPISFDRFFKCIEKFKQAKETSSLNDEFIAVKSGTSVYRIKPNDILYLEKDGNYCYYIMVDRKIMARESVKEALNKLPAYFYQIHKSYIANLNKVSEYGNDFLVIGNKKLTLSDSFRKTVLNKLS